MSKHDAQQDLKAKIMQKEMIQEITLADFQRLARLSPTAMAISHLPDGKFIDANQLFLDLHGYQRDEVIGKSSEELGLWAKTEKREQAIDIVGKQAKPYTFIIEYRTRSGRTGTAIASIELVKIDGEPHLLGSLSDTSELESTRRALADNEMRYNSLFNNMLNGFAYCRMLYRDGEPYDYQYLSVNKAFETLTGLKDVIGHTVRELLPGVVEADPAILAVYGKVARGAAPIHVERFVPLLKTWYSVTTYGQEPDHFAIIFDAITERKLAESALRASEERYRAVVQDQTEIISRWRADGTCIFANDVYCRFLGNTEAEMIGASWHPIIHPDDLERVKQELAALSVDNAVITIENRIFSGSGAVHWMQFINRGVFDENGALLEIQSVGRDITDRKKTEAELRLAHRELQRHVEELQKLAVEATLAEERERTAIADDLHDDLGQLLHITKLKLDALAKMLPTSLNPNIIEISEFLARASRLVRSLTSQLSPPGLKDLGLKPALHWLAEEMGRFYLLNVVVIDDEKPVRVSHARAAIIYRAVREVLINVAKHARVSSATLKIWCQDAHLFISVTDEGIGFTENDPATVAIRGHGLSSVSERIGFLRGNFRVRSIPGKGTTVTIAMPNESNEVERLNKK